VYSFLRGDLVNRYDMNKEKVNKIINKIISKHSYLFPEKNNYINLN